MMPQPRGPQGKKLRKPIDPIEQQKANIRTSLMLIAAALTQTDMYTCDQKFQGTMDKLTGTSSSSSSAAR